MSFQPQSLSFQSHSELRRRHRTSCRDSDLLDAGLVEENEIKLTHHLDGFVQFSGKGVFSGREKDGTIIKGMGVLSSPLHKIFSGPSFVYAIQNIATLEQVENLPTDGFILDLDEYSTIDGSESLTVEAHYFVPGWRRFIRYDSKNRPVIYVPHPCGAMVEFRVFESSLECKFPGFLGFEVYRMKLQLPEDGYSFGGPSGNMRKNEKGERIADGIFCVYPMQENMPAKRSLNHPQKPLT